MTVESDSALPCPFCHEIEQANSGVGLSFICSDSAIGVPTLGCFALGYSLIVPRTHNRSVAEASPQDILGSLTLAEEVRAKIEMLIGPAIIAEHGSGSPDEPTAACCVHSHLHIIPVRQAALKTVAEYETRGGAGRKMDFIRDLPGYAGQSYLTVSVAPGEWLIWPDASRFPRQFVRRAVTTALGMPEMFDWRLQPFPEKMAATSDILKRAFGQQP